MSAGDMEKQTGHVKERVSTYFEYIRILGSMNKAETSLALCRLKRVVRYSVVPHGARWAIRTPKRAIFGRL